MRRVRVEEAAAVGADHLDRLLRGDRAHRQRLRGLGFRFLDRLAGRVDDRLAVGVGLRDREGHRLHHRDRGVGREVLHDAAAGEEQREQRRGETHQHQR